MGIYKCRKCGKQYEVSGLTDGFCHECLMEQLDKYHQVREYLWENPGKTASEVSKACDCSVHQVMQWVKEDRFMLTDGSRILLYCAGCGVKIASGVYCTKCKAKMAQEEKAASKSALARMHAATMHGTALNGRSAEDGSMRFLNKRNSQNNQNNNKK